MTEAPAGEKRQVTPELEQLYAQVEDIEIAMLTTRRADGHLESRPMATQKRAAGADLWFVAADGAAVVEQVEAEPHVNLAYYKDRTREWVSVSGEATLSRDRTKIHELYAPDWKLWFADEGAPRDGGPDDPRFVLVGVTIHDATFMELGKPQPLVLFDLAKSVVTRKTPELGETHHVEG